MSTGMLRSALEPLRSGPGHRSEMISELRSGEAFEILETQDKWHRVRGADGYEGWLYHWAVGPVAEGAPLGRYALPLGTLWDSDQRAASSLSLGMALWPGDPNAPEREGLRHIRLGHGPEGWLPANEILDPERTGGVENLFGSIRALLGTPYRWGGRSALGLDCSGYVQLCAELSGLSLPRDAKDQAACGREVDPELQDSWEAGDLILFGAPADHIGFCDGKGGLYHCRGQVRRDLLREVPALAARVSTVRRMEWPEWMDERVSA